MQIESWRKTIVPETICLRDAVEQLQDTGLQILLVVSKQDKLLGTITDGDIRKGILSGMSLNDSSEVLVNRKPVTCSTNDSAQVILMKMEKHGVQQIPIIDRAGNIAGLHVWSVHLPKIEAAMLIMAGGQGKRLRPHTIDCPKPLIEVGGKPMMQHILEQAIEVGITRFFVSINYLGDQIVDYFGDGSSFGVTIVYLKEDKPLGTAGCLSFLKGQLNSTLIIINGDVMTDVNLGEMFQYHQKLNAAITIGTKRHEYQNPYGVLKIEGTNVVDIEEKPVYTSQVSAGVYVVDPSVIYSLGDGDYLDMPDLILRHVEDGRRVCAYSIHEKWIDIGRPEDLKRARQNH